MLKEQILPSEWTRKQEEGFYFMVMCKKIRWARLRAGLSQAALAEAAGIPVVDMCSYEDGKMNPGIQELASLSRILGISFFYLRQNDCEDPLEHIHMQEALFEFYDSFGPDALQRYADVVSVEIEQDKARL